MSDDVNGDNDLGWPDMIVARALFIAARYREMDVLGCDIIDEVHYAESKCFDAMLRTHFPSVVGDLQAEWDWKSIRSV